MFESIKDEELLLLIKNKDDDYYKELLNRYLKKYPYIVKQVAKSLNQKGVDVDDFLFDFFNSFETSRKAFIKEKGKFRSIFKIIFERKVRNTIVHNIKSKDALDHCIFLSETINEDMTYYDVVENKNADNLPSYYDNSSIILLFNSSNKKPRSRKHSKKIKALELRSKGCTYKEIAEKLNLTISKVRRMVDLKEDKKFKDIYLKFK